MQEFEFGCFQKMKFPQTSRTQAAAPIHRRGKKLWQIFPAHTATSARISRIKVSSQILTFAATSLVPLHTTRTSTTVQTLAPNLRQRTERTSQTLTGSSITSRYTKRPRFHTARIISSMGKEVEIIPSRVLTSN